MRTNTILHYQNCNRHADYFLLIVIWFLVSVCVCARFVFWVGCYMSTFLACTFLALQNSLI